MADGGAGSTAQPGVVTKFPASVATIGSPETRGRRSPVPPPRPPATRSDAAVRTESREAVAGGAGGPKGSGGSEAGVEEGRPVEDAGSGGDAAPRWPPEAVAACVAAVRELVPEAAHRCDGTVRRFCRARKLDAEAAAQMLRDDLAWREEHGADTILDEPFEFGRVFDCVTPHISYPVRDQHGRPLYIERTGDVNMPRVLEIIDVDDLVRRHIWHMEVQERRLGHEGQLVRIMDMARMSFKPDSASLPIFRTVMDIDANHYPERLAALYIINAPWVFKPIWAIISPWIDPLTRSKFRILGGPSEFVPVLVREIGSRALPLEYGGTCSVEVPTLVEPGTDTCGLHELNIQARAEQTYTVHFTGPRDGSAAEILWCVRLAAHTISFSAVWVPDAADGEAAPVVVHELKEVSPTGEHALRGRFAPPPGSSGELRLRFDNTASRWRGKTVMLLVEDSFRRDEPPERPEGDVLPPPFERRPSR